MLIFTVLSLCLIAMLVNFTKACSTNDIRAFKKCIVSANNKWQLVISEKHKQLVNEVDSQLTQCLTGFRLCSYEFLKSSASQKILNREDQMVKGSRIARKVSKTTGRRSNPKSGKHNKAKSHKKKMQSCMEKLITRDQLNQCSRFPRETIDLLITGDILKTKPFHSITKLSLNRSSDIMFQKPKKFIRQLVNNVKECHGGQKRKANKCIRTSKKFYATNRRKLKEDLKVAENDCTIIEDCRRNSKKAQSFHGSCKKKLTKGKHKKWNKKLKKKKKVKIGKLNLISKLELFFCECGQIK